MAYYLDEYPPNPYGVSSELDYPDRQPTTRIVRKVDKQAKQRQDEKQAVNRKRHLAIGKSIYGALRFLPYLRYVTDVLDIAGLSPDINEPDATDMTQGVSHYGNGYFSVLKKKEENTPVGTKRKVGRGKHRHSFTVTQDIKNEGIKIYDTMAKGARTLGLVGLGGDIAQEYNNLKELYNLYK